ncbi:MAG TPA: SIS domain-containing protein [Candidatus Limnocylindria bacterium]|nr:SIS domain-containing protein [Candidatus Limnocylindria bacterium]
MALRDEILEQPAALARLLDAAPRAYAGIAAALKERRPRFVLIAARGTSDNAALYAQYLFAIRNSLTVALAAPSTVTLYRARPDMRDALVIGISQSGRSPDILAVLQEARDQGALTVALVNDASSPLVAAADHVVDLRAGPERATAATKSYTNELLAVALLSTALDAATQDETADLARLPDLVAAALSTEETARAVSAGHAARTHGVVLGRGFAYATAREWSLKLQELAQLLVQPYSTADFEHGPLALAEPGFAVLAVAPSGVALEGQLEVLYRLRHELGARVLVVSDLDEVLGLDEGLRLPGNVPGWLSPIVEIVPGQLYAYHLTAARGLDPDRPRTIGKVTETL